MEMMRVFVIEEPGGSEKIEGPERFHPCPGPRSASESRLGVAGFGRPRAGRFGIAATRTQGFLTPAH